MASPPNQTATTAMAITTLPFSVTQDVADQLSTLQLWYTYTATVNDLVLGCVPYADVSSPYEPALTIYTGPASAPVLYRVNNSLQRSSCVPVTAGTVYLFKVTQHGATSPVGASLTFILQTSPALSAPAGSIIAAEENTGFYTPVLSGDTDETTFYYIADATFPIAVIGAQLSDGTLMGDDFGNLLAIYSPTLTRVFGGLPYYAFMPQWITSNRQGGLFYLPYQPTFGSVLTLRTLTAAGATTTDTWTLPSDSSTAHAGAATADNTIFYYGGNGATAVHRYDLVNSTPLSDLVAAIATYNISEMLLLADSTLLVVYRKLGGSPDYQVKHYSSAGATLNTYSFGTTWIDHIMQAPDDPASFWIWLHNTASSPTIATYRRIKVSDGSTISEGVYNMFAGGPSQLSYDPTYVTAESVPLFGPAPTCTFFITYVDTGSIPPPPPAPATIEDPIRWVRRGPTVFNDGKRFRVTRLQFDFQPGVGLSSLPTDESHDPIVRYRGSFDGGFTWSGFREFTLGAQGDYLKLMKLYQNGSGYAFVPEISGNTPTDFCLVQAWIDAEEWDH